MQFRNIGFMIMIYTNYKIYMLISMFSQLVHRRRKILLYSRYIRGNGGVAILWRKTLDRSVRKLQDISNDRLVAIQLLNLHRPICWLLYLVMVFILVVTFKIGRNLWLYHTPLLQFFLRIFRYCNY